jgi:hypothetical protein
MTDQATAPMGGDDSPVLAQGDLSEGITAEEAVAAYRNRTNPSAESAPAATAENELSVEDNAAPPQEATGETQESDPAETPPLDLPRSWTKEQAEHWKALPRATQEFLTEQASKQSDDVRRVQNEAAAERKAAQAEREQAVQERKMLAAKLPEVERAVQEFLAHKYPDIRSMDDVAKMAHEAERLWPIDPFAAGEIGARLKAWEVDQQKIALSLADARNAQASEARERESNLFKYQAEETSKLAEFHPEIKKPDELKALTTKAVNHLKSFDFTDQQLNEYTAQGDKPFIYSAGFQRILLNSLKYEEMKATAPKAIPKPVPAVQRPGVVTTNRGADAIKASREKLNSTGSVDDAFVLYQAKKSRAS